MFSEPEKQSGGPSVKSSKETSAPFLECDTPGKWIAFMRGSLAKICQSQESAPAWTEIEVRCMLRPSASFGKFDPDTSSLRTSQASLPLMGEKLLTELCLTWPASGLMLDGYLHPGPMLERGLAVKDGGAWPRLCARDHRHGMSVEALERRKGHPRGANLAEFVQRKSGKAGGVLNPLWCEWYMGWPRGSTKDRKG